MCVHVYTYLGRGEDLLTNRLLAEVLQGKKKGKGYQEEFKLLASEVNS